MKYKQMNGGKKQQEMRSECPCQVKLMRMTTKRNTYQTFWLPYQGAEVLRLEKIPLHCGRDKEFLQRY